MLGAELFEWFGGGIGCLQERDENAREVSELITAITDLENILMREPS